MNKKEIINEYQDYKPVTNEDLEEILSVLGLISEDVSNNAQVFCHGCGKRGYDNIDKILNNGGLAINRLQFEETNSYVAEGMLSTNIIANNQDNSLNLDKLRWKYGYTDKKGESLSVITAFPVEIGDYILGRMTGRDPKEKNCLLDELKIQSIPKEFIIGVMKHHRDSDDIEFKLNNNFYALNSKNYEKGVEAIGKIYENSWHKSQDELLDSINNRLSTNMKREEKGLKPIEIPKYLTDIFERSILKEIKKEEGIEV